MTLPPSHRVHRSWLKNLERLLWILSFALLATVTWMKVDAWRFQAASRAAWEERLGDRAKFEREGTPESRTAATPFGPGSINPASASSPSAAPGTALGQLRIPRLDLEVMVAEGTTEEVLQHAVGHLTGSAVPGILGNVVLAGHRDTFFRPLERVRIGDRVEFDDGFRRHSYRVESTQVVGPEQVEVARPTPKSVLTLITCYPFRFIGAAPERFVVRARQIDDEERGEVDPGDEERHDVPVGG